MKSQSDMPVETPLAGGAKFFLTIRACLAVSAFYGFAFATVFLSTVWIALELAVGFVAGFFVRAIGIRRKLRTHFRILRAFLRSFRLDKAIEARIELQRDDALDLFQMVESLCAQMAVRFPGKVFLEMQLNAWVRLKGWGDGRGANALGLGYDLLAGLSVGELEAVLAHEFTHARLTQRALRDWLEHGLERAVQLVRGLTEPRRAKAAPSALGSFLPRIADSIAESAARWIAALSRQEEFEADFGAAEICGAERARRVLIRVESLNRFTARVPWAERVAQLEAHAFRPWLVKELSAVKSMEPLEIAAQIPDRFSTHPSLRERLNALPSGDVSEEWDQRPAMDLLLDADAVAEKLMARIEQKSIEHEERDTKALRRWARQMREATDARPMQLAGAGLVVASEIAGAIAWIFGAPLEVVLVILDASILGLLIYWQGRWRDKFTLPTPDFGLLKKTWQPARPVTDEQLSEMEADLRLRAKRSKKPAWTILAPKSVDALSQCDFPKAAAAAKLCLEYSPKSLQHALILAVSSAWLGRGQETSRALGTIQQQAGLRGEAICWGVAWTYMLRGNWARAEALLDQILDGRSDATLLNLRALCQSRRGKIQSAIISARRACHPQPINREHAKFLIDLLLEGGYLREAERWLRPMDKAIAQDSELILTTIRLNLLLQNFFAAHHWSETLLATCPPAYMIVRMGAIYEISRQLENAGRFYKRALEEAFYPDACLGLARLEAQQNNLAVARRHALDALNLRRPLGQYATPPLELLSLTLNQLAALEPPTRFCHAWTVTLEPNAVPSAIGGAAFVVYAVNEAQAERHFETVLSAMAGGSPRLVPGKFVWQLARPEHQPFGVAHPGAQLLSNGRETTAFRGFQRRGLWHHYISPQTTMEVVQPVSLPQEIESVTPS